MEFELKAIIPSPDDYGVYTVYLFCTVNKMLLPIKCDQWGAESLILAKSGKILARPHVHNTFGRCITALGGQVIGAVLYKVLGDIFYTYLRIKKAEEEFDIDARFSDAVSIALLHNVPIFVEKEVFSVAGFKITRKLIEKSLGI